MNLHTNNGLTKAPARPETVSRELENFIYLISHDLRNSMRALMEVPQWIEEDLKATGHRLSPSMEENITLMNTHTRRLDRMMCDLLIYSRIGRMQDVVAVDLEELLDEALSETRVPAGFTLRSALECPAIVAGAHDVRTLMTALITNAIKHHDRREGQITVASRREGGACLLWVTDDGPGIAPQHRDKVCEIMSTLKPRDEVEGSGMGLAMVRKIAAVYGGQVIWPELPGTAAGGRGTAIGLRLPLAD